VRSHPPLLAFAFALSAGVIQAQEATPPPAEDDTRRPVAPGEASKVDDRAADSAAESTQSEPKEKETKKDPDKLAPGEVRVKAESQGGERGHYQASGNVELRSGDFRILSDRMDVYEFDRPDGTKGKKVIAVGNVVFLHEEERLAGERLTMDLDAGTGVFENAHGYMEPGILVEGRRIERIDAVTYRVEGGKFTACTQPDPRWGFTTTSAKILVNDKVLAKNVVFKVKQVPALYFPFLVYPIKDDQRSSGILFPHFGSSTIRGFNVGTGFFWAMGRSADQTFYADRYSKAGYGVGHELRWALDSPSRGTLKSYAFSPQEGSIWDYDFDWNAIQVLPGRARASLVVRRYSNTLFQTRYQDNFNLATSRTERILLSVQRNFSFANFQASAEDNRVFFSDNTRINRRLPSVRLNRQPKRIGRTPFVLGLEARAERLGRGDDEGIAEYARFDLLPDFSLPFSTTFLQVTPRLRARYTRYGASLTELSTDDATGPSLDRRYLEGSVSVSGPTFSRVFDTPGGAYTDKFKHVLGPEVTWSYRTPVDEFLSIPKFDGVDQQLGTHQVDYGLVQRLYARRPGPSGKLAPWEFLSWTLYQTYYIKIAEGQNEFDPNYSSNIFGPGGVPDHNSPIRSRVRVRPARAITGTFDLEYDVNFEQIRNLSLGGAVAGERGSLETSWNRANRVAVDPRDRRTIRNFVRGATSFQVLPRRLTLEGSANYDYVNRSLLQSVARLRWDVQCCGFMVETIQFNYNGRDERQFRFSIELANIGSIGNFMGDEQPGRQGIGGVGGLR
jgi:LPS-assembly protein